MKPFYPKPLFFFPDTKWIQWTHSLLTIYIYAVDCGGKSMDLTTLDFIRITIGMVILMYVANCLLNQKVWIRKIFSWGTKEEYPKIFQMNIIGGSLIGIFLIASPFMW